MKTRSPGMVKSSVVVVLATTLFLPAEARSQEQPDSISPITVGARVRLLAPTAVKGRVEGTVMQIDEKSLLVSTDDRIPLRVSRQAITRLEVSTGRHRKALKGMIIGAGIGAVLGAFQPRDLGCLDACPDQTKAEVVGLFMFGGALYGVGIGALIKKDRWGDVPLERVRVSLAPTRGRGVGLSLSVGF